MPSKRTTRNVRSVPRSCKQCRRDFLAIKGQVEIGRSKYCSPVCSQLGKIKSADIIWSMGIRQESGCLELPGSISGQRPYGRIQVNYVRYLIHRLAWMLTHGEIPDTLEVCHTCDNPPCYEPSHLFLGTHQENAQDMARKGRSAAQRHPEIILRGDAHPSRHNPPYLRPGESNSSAKLTEDDVRDIRVRYARGVEFQRDISLSFGVTQTLVSQIVRRKIWKHVV